jgi:hypothetical protein
MSPTTNGDEKVLGSRDLKGLLNVARVGAARDRCRPAVDRGVPDGARFVVTVVVGENETAAEARAQARQCGIHRVLLSPRFVDGVYEGLFFDASREWQEDESVVYIPVAVRPSSGGWVPT